MKYTIQLLVCPLYEGLRKMSNMAKTKESFGSYDQFLSMIGCICNGITEPKIEIESEKYQIKKHPDGVLLVTP